MFVQINCVPVMQERGAGELQVLRLLPVFHFAKFGRPVLFWQRPPRQFRFPSYQVNTSVIPSQEKRLQMKTPPDREMYKGVRKPFHDHLVIWTDGVSAS